MLNNKAENTQESSPSQVKAENIAHIAPIAFDRESAPILVKTGDVAKALSVSMRQVGYWSEEGRIPCYRLGKRCVRYSLPEVLKALEIETPVH